MSKACTEGAILKKYKINYRVLKILIKLKYQTVSRNKCYYNNMGTYII